MFHPVSSWWWRNSPFSFVIHLKTLTRTQIPVLLYKAVYICHPWSTLLSVWTVISFFWSANCFPPDHSLCFVSQWGLVRQAVCTLLEKPDCCENLCHINRNKALAHLDTITSNFSLITSATQLHQLRHVTGKKYQLKDHLVKNEEYFPGWQVAKRQNAHAHLPWSSIPKRFTPWGVLIQPHKGRFTLEEFSMILLEHPQRLLYFWN